MDSGASPITPKLQARPSQISGSKGQSDVSLQIQARGDRQLKIKVCRPSLLLSTILLWLYYFLCIMSSSENNEELINKIKIPTLAKYKVYRNISIEGDDFVLDGKKLQILSGSFHYFRTPAAYWRDRLRKLRAAGLNAVSTYVEWSFHETEERQYNFEGDRDIVSFINLAAEEGLFVLLRPGPYICAERDLGGFPYWLLGKYPNIRLRTLDTDFMYETTIWMEKLFEYITPLLYAYGGPIILIQVENEYGSHFYKKFYMAAMRDMLLKHVGPHALLYTTDGASSCYFKPGSVNGTLTTIDFGSDNNVERAFTSLRKYMPHGPLMNSEFYLGWITHWGKPFQRRSINDIVSTLTQMLEKSIHINFYMFYGGTNFGFTAGANYFSKYQPDITSYDYDAPLTEAGDPTEKYFVIRDVIEKYNLDVGKFQRPNSSPKGAYGEVVLKSKLELLSPEGRTALGKIHAPATVLPTFEKLRQRSGLLMFETKVSLTMKPNQTQWLVITKPRDHVYVYLDGVLQGFLNRMNHVYAMRLKIKSNNTVLSLLVENLGRINYGPKIHDLKGILSPVFLDHKPVKGVWSVTGYPLETLPESPRSSQRRRSELAGPVLYQGSIILPPGEQPLETFLDTSGWRKGYIWINGYNLGRYWQIGPQKTLYVPGVWLKQAPAQNLIQVLELEDAPSNLTLKFIDHPILDKLNIENINWHWPDRQRLDRQNYKLQLAN